MPCSNEGLLDGPLSRFCDRTRTTPASESRTIPTRSPWTIPPAELIPQYYHDLVQVQRGLEADLRKTVCEGKSILIEGLHAHPTRLAAFIHSLARQEQTQPCVVIPFLIDIGDPDVFAARVWEWERRGGTTHPSFPRGCEEAFGKMADMLRCDARAGDVNVLPMPVAGCADSTLETMHSVVLEQMGHVVLDS